MAGRVALGAFLGDRDRRAAAAANFLLQAGGTVLLAVGPSPAILLTGCVLFGLGIGNLISLPPLIAQKEFAGGDVPRVVALVTAVNQAVFSFAPAVFGALRDATGGYAIPVLVAAVMQAAAALAVLVGRQSR